MAIPAPLTAQQQKIGLNASPTVQQNNNLASDNNPQTYNKGATSPAAGSTTTQNTANASGNLDLFGGVIPQPNVLDRFASYTWAASVYLLSTEQYTQLVQSTKKNINGYNLLFQSGGAPNNTGGFQGKLNPALNAPAQQGTTASIPPGTPGANSPDAGRNPAFGLDFYIDNITIDNSLPGKVAGAPHMVTDIKFTVTEPGNISLIDRLYQAVQDANQTEAGVPIPYTAAQYLMVLRFYGYDENGVLIPVGAADPNTGLSDPNAVIEKFIPFQIARIKWSVTSKLVQYDFECKPVGQFIGDGTRRGTIFYDTQLSAKTVGDLLAGDAAYRTTVAPSNNPGGITTVAPGGAANGSNSRDNSNSTTSAPTKAIATPTTKNSAKQGLMAAVTEYSRQLVTQGTYEQADTYEIEFAKGAEAIRDATITLPGNVFDKQSVPMANTNNPNQLKNPAANGMDVTSRTFSLTSGMQIVQAIDLAIRNSSYIYGQALSVYNQITDQQELKPEKVNKPVNWFEISIQATPKKFDAKRNDFAYHIKYTISVYGIQNFSSKYFPSSKFRGVHKSYPYWFTGQNTAVLDYTANFNHTYSQTVSGTGIGDNLDSQNRAAQTSNMYDLMQYSFSPRSQASNKGAGGKGNETAANAAEYLYMYAEPGGSKLQIIGDPAWIQQGSLAGGVSAAEFSYNPFNPDGTINFDSEQVLFEIAWQRPEDYNIATGLADPYARAGNESRKPAQSNVYQATKVTSEFKGGKFEQTITGSLFMLPTITAKNAAAGSGSGDGQRNAADPRRLDAAAEPAATNRPSAPTANNTTTTQANGQRVPAGVFSSPDYSIYKSQAAGLIPGGPVSSPTRPLAVPNRLTGAFSAPPPGTADNVAAAAPPRAATGSGVLPLAFGNAPLPLNTLPFATQGKAQIISKDS
jgi:hypothetical protein